MSFAAEGGQRVYDEAGLLDIEDIQTLEQEAGRLEEQMDMSVVLLTVKDAEGLTTQEYAEEFYEVGDFGRGSSWSGILFIIDMDNREFYIVTSGVMTRFITDERREDILDAAANYMADGDYAGAMSAFLAQTQACYQKGIPGNQYSYDVETGAVSRWRSIRWYEFLLAFGIAGFCGAGACLNVKRQYEMKDEQTRALNYQMAYRADSKFAFTNQNDVMTNRFVTQAIIPRSNFGGGKGGGFSGGSSSGRSSTHTSSGGRTFGGGGRKF